MKGGLLIWRIRAQGARSQRPKQFSLLRRPEGVVHGLLVDEIGEFGHATGNGRIGEQFAGCDPAELSKGRFEDGRPFAQKMCIDEWCNQWCMGLGQVVVAAPDDMQLRVRQQ